MKLVVAGVLRCDGEGSPGWKSKNFQTVHTKTQWKIAYSSASSGILADACGVETVARCHKHYGKLKLGFRIWTRAACERTVIRCWSTPTSPVRDHNRVQRGNRKWLGIFPSKGYTMLRSA